MSTENKVRYGLKNVHVAIIENEKDGKEVYGQFRPMRGAVSLTLSPVGEQTPFHADDRTFHVFSANSGYEGTLELAEIPEFFSTDVLGEKKHNGVIVENVDMKGKSFAMAFEFNGDKKATRHVLYNCTANRPEITGETVGESAEAQTSELTFTSAPTISGQVRAKTSAETPANVYDDWYTKPFTSEAIEDAVKFTNKMEGQKQ